MRNTKFLYFDFLLQFEKKEVTSVPNFCCNDELSQMMISVGCLLFILFTENSQILLKFTVIPCLFHVSGSTESVCKQLTQRLIIAAEISYKSCLFNFKLQQKSKQINFIFCIWFLVI